MEALVVAYLTTAPGAMKSSLFCSSTSTEFMQHDVNDPSVTSQIFFFVVEALLFRFLLPF